MNDKIQQRLLHFSENPPVSAWPRIAEALDESVYVQKLHDFQTPPPVGVWKKLEAQLMAPAKLRPIRTKLFQYAIAAAVLLFVAAGSIFYFKHKSETNLANSTASNGTSNALLKKSLTGATAEKQKAENEDTEAGNATMAAASGAALVHFSPQVQIAKKSFSPSPITINPEPQKIEKTSINTELPDRYIIATTRTGKVVRLPKKAYDVYACAETYQNFWCKEKIAAIQNKLAASVATDFTDFIDLLKNLQDNP